MPERQEVSISSSQKDWGVDVAAMAGSLVHEIKNPLSTINLSAQLLQEEWKDASTPKEQRALRRLEVMSSEVQRVERIIETFLRFTERHKLALEVKSLNEMLEDLGGFGKVEQEILTGVCQENKVPQVLVSKLLHAEFSSQGMGKHSKVFKSINKILSEEWRDNLNEIVDGMKKERADHALVFDKLLQNIYVIGGYDGFKRIKECERYSIYNNEWTSIAQLSQEKSAVSACIADNKCIYAFGCKNA